MKKLFVLVFLVVAGLSSYSQYDYDNYMSRPKHNDKYNDALSWNGNLFDYVLCNDFGGGDYTSQYYNQISKDKIKTYKKFKSKNNTNEHLSYSYEFNNYGRTIEENTYSLKGKLKKHFLNKYDDYNFITEFKVINSKGEIKWLVIYKYNPFEQISYSMGKVKDTTILKGITEFISYKYNKMIFHNTQKFDSLKKLERVNYKRGGNGIKNRYEYKFYADGSRKETILYNSKGKIKYIWSYDCKAEGEIVSPHKDTIQICKWNEIDKDSNYINVDQTTDEKNRIIKLIYKYNKEHSLIESSRYNEKEQLKYKHIAPSKDNNIEQNTNYYYNRKGELKKRKENIQKYDDKDNRIEWIDTKYKDKKGKKVVKYMDKREYDNNNNLICTEIFKKRGEELHKKEEYKYDNNKHIICKEIFKYKKGVWLLNKKEESKYNEKGLKTESVITYYRKGVVRKVLGERFVYEYFE